MAERVDGIVEAVRYEKGGCIDMVRVFERRGATYSDHVLLQRADLVDRLRKRKKFYAGTRQQFMASTFHLTLPLRLMKADDREVITTTWGDTACDDLTGVPLF